MVKPVPAGTLEGNQTCWPAVRLRYPVTPAIAEKRTQQASGVSAESITPNPRWVFHTLTFPAPATPPLLIKTGPAASPQVKGRPGRSEDYEPACRSRSRLGRRSCSGSCGLSVLGPTGHTWPCAAALLIGRATRPKEADSRRTGYLR